MLWAVEVAGVDEAEEVGEVEEVDEVGRAPLTLLAPWLRYPKISFAQYRKR